MINQNGLGILISDRIVYKGTIEIGHCSRIGDIENSDILVIGENIKIGAYCLIEGGSTIGNNAFIDDYCAIYHGARIGHNLKLLYSKKIYGKAVIGNDCIIGGNIPERCIVSDRVTFMGEVAHSHYNPQSDWDTTDEPSPFIGEGSIIGVNSLIIGGVKIGSNCYISAGEILRHDLPNNSVFIKNKIFEMKYFKGLIKTRY